VARLGSRLGRDEQVACKGIQRRTVALDVHHPLLLGEVHPEFGVVVPVGEWSAVVQCSHVHPHGYGLPLILSHRSSQAPCRLRNALICQVVKAEPARRVGGVDVPRLGDPLAQLGLRIEQIKQGLSRQGGSRCRLTPAGR